MSKKQAGFPSDMNMPSPFPNSSKLDCEFNMIYKRNHIRTHHPWGRSAWERSEDLRPYEKFPLFAHLILAIKFKPSRRAEINFARSYSAAALCRPLARAIR